MESTLQANGTWKSSFRYQDIYVKTRVKCKRGFETEEEADAFESDFLRRMEGSLDMRFVDFVDVYTEDLRPTLRESTLASKEYMINDKLVPFFGKKRLRDITAKDIVQWQNKLLEGKKKDGTPYSETYVRTVNNQLVAILAHAERYYGLVPNPMDKAPRIGSKNTQEVNIWSRGQYLAFSEKIADDEAFVPIEVLYWTGIRLGELLALTPDDIDFNRSEIYVRHSYRRIRKKDVVGDPKTAKSARKIVMPEFLRDEIRDYIRDVSGAAHNERIFAGVSAKQPRRALDVGSEEMGLPRIRIHDLRHSHVSLLIDMGYSAVAIADRTGHESTEITFRYAHLMPDAQEKMADALSKYRGDGDAM